MRERKLCEDKIDKKSVNMKIESNSAEETFALGKQCGEKAAAGQVYCLYGDLGVGKPYLQRICGRTWNQRTSQQSDLYYFTGIR